MNILKKLTLYSSKRHFLIPYYCIRQNIRAYNTLELYFRINEYTMSIGPRRTFRTTKTHSQIFTSIMIRKSIKSVEFSLICHPCSIYRNSSLIFFSSTTFSASHSIWGWSGLLLNFLHIDGIIPLWACMSIVSLMVRISLIPLVIRGARTSIQFASVAPEVRFLLLIFLKDLRKLKKENKSISEVVALFRINWRTLNKIYKLHNISPTDLIKSPIMQIPVFWYFSIDLRKIVNGGDPDLAKKLTESDFLWITDLTAPDPFYALPVISGLLLYTNVEISLGKKNLSGEQTSKSTVAVAFKDFFQSLAIFMPCFMSNTPSGVQIYLATSFAFTLLQGKALRNGFCRKFCDLPSEDTKTLEPKIAKEFIDLKKRERKAVKEKKRIPITGKGILAPGWEVFFSGKFRESSIKIVGKSPYLTRNNLT